MEKEIEIEWNGKPEIVVVKSLVYGDELEIRKKIKRATQVGVEVDFGLQDLLVFQASLKKAPFSTDQETIKNLPLSVSSKIETAITEINGVSNELKKN